MADLSPPDLETEAQPSDKQPLTALIGQIVDDTRSFARDEIAFLQAQAGERAQFATPGIISAAVAVALGMGALIAFLVGLTIWLATIINAGLAAMIVAVVALLAAVAAWQWGTGRLRKALKSRDER
jgi:hypothetical protein